MTPRRSFLDAVDLDTIRKVRTYGELCLWRVRAAGGERRAALLEGARAAYSCAASVMRRARLAAVGEPSDDVVALATARVHRAGVRLMATRSTRAGGPDA